MSEPGPVTRALLALDDDPAAGACTVARQICEAYIGGLDVDGAALSLLTGTTARRTLSATDEIAERLEDLQFSLNEGACVEAAATGRPVLEPDLRENAEYSRWPLFAAAVAQQTPVAAVFAFPLRWGTANLGVIDLYRTTPGELSPHQVNDAVAATDPAALLLLAQHTAPRATDYADRAEREDMSSRWLGPAAGHRAGIHQATGMVLAQLGIDPIDALARLRGHAFSHDQPLDDVARDVVARRLVFTHEMK